MKLAHVKSNIYIDFSKEINKEHLKFKDDGHVRL